MRKLALFVACACSHAPGQTVTAQPDAPPPIVTPDPDASSDAADGNPIAGVDWFTWPAQQQLSDPSWGDDLTDIANHLPAQYGDQYWDSDAITAGHETTHGIQAHLRNYEAPAPIGWNAFYVLGDKAAFVQEPNMRKADVAPFVPASLRGPRFDTYVTGQTEWDDTPLYLFDEWAAYCNGASVGVDQVQNNLYQAGWTDAVMGPLEFVVYAIATAASVQAHDPGYFATNDQFKRFTAWQIARAMALYAQGSVMREFSWDTQDAYLASLRTSADAADLRQFARDTWGAAWVQQILGF